MNRYFEKLKQLLPKGPIWDIQENDELLKGLSKGFQRIHEWFDELLMQANPLTTTSLLKRWEKIVGLPDECAFQSANKTFYSRKASVITKLSYIGEQNIDFYKNLAKNLGYEIEIIEYKPFIAGLSRCGQNLNGPHNVRYCWTYRIKGINANLTYFRVGTSQCREKLLTINLNRELECRIKKASQPHTQPIAEYEVK